MIRISLAAAAVVLFATAAQAGSAPQLAVSYGDLNLGSPADQAKLSTRIHDAAVKVCGPVQYSLDNRGSEMNAAEQANRSCVRNASQAALTRIETARLASQGKVQKVAGN